MVIKNLFSSLKSVLQIIKKYPTIEICVTTIDQSYTISYYENFDHYDVKYNYNSLTINHVMKLLLKKNIHLIEIYGSIGIKYVNKILYNYKKVFAIKIQKAWRKYIIHGARIRNDLVLHGLAEYFYHPSRISFDI
jgi:hypothetical protein